MGTHQVGVVKVDVVTGHAPSAAPDVLRVTPLIDLAWPADWPEAKVYPVANHLADKVCAMFERHKGSPSSRYRDLADILLISQNEAIDGRYVQLALRTEARRRRLTAAPGIDLVLPSAFQCPGPAWPDRYPAAASQVPGLKGCATWKDAATAAETFLTPLLAPGAPGYWNAADSAWRASPEHNSPQAHAELAHPMVGEPRQQPAALPPPPPQRPRTTAQPARPDVPPPTAGPGMAPGR